MNLARFSELNDDLCAQRVALLDADEAVRVIGIACATWEGTEMADINAVTDPVTGKAMFSNDSKRDAEMIIRKSASADWNALEGKLLAAKRDASVQRAQISSADNFLKFVIANPAL